MVSPNETQLADGLWTLLWAQATAEEPPKVTLNVLNSDWKTRLKFEMRTCKMTKFHLKWFAKFPNHFQVCKGVIVAIPADESVDEEETLQSRRPQIVVLQNAAREAAKTLGKKVSFGGTETFTFKIGCSSANMKGKKSRKKRTGFKISPPVSGSLRLYDLAPDSDDSDFDIDSLVDPDPCCCDGFTWAYPDDPSDMSPTSVSTASTDRSADSPDESTAVVPCSTETRATENSVGAPNRHASTLHFWLGLYSTHRELARHALVREYGM